MLKSFKTVLVFSLALFASLSGVLQTRAAGSPRILFTSDRDSGYGIFTMGADGKNVVQIANDTTDPQSAPAWSPDGKQIAYLSRRDGYPAVYVINAVDGSNAQRISSQDFSETFSPVWSSTGRIAFYANSRKGPSGLFSVKPDGSDQKLILNKFAFGYTWSPDGTQIAYMDGNSIVVINADGSGQQQVNKDSAYYESVTWAPDGKSVLTNSFGNGKQGVYSLDVKTGAAHRLSVDSSARSPSWSPDGKTIAYISSDFNSGGIYTVDATGRNRKQLTNSYELGFAWSPDSKQIAFNSNRNRSVQIYSMALDGTDLKKITTAAGWYSEPQLSPDGSQIAYTLLVNGKDQIFVMNSDGSNQKQLTTGTAIANLQPIWTSDSKQIIFYSIGNGLALDGIGVDGKNQKRLVSFSSGPGGGPNAVLSPDGTQIAYGAGGPSDIYIAGVDGKSPKRLSKGGGYNPQWSPDGKHIAFLGGPQNTVQEIDVDGKNQRQIAQDYAFELAWAPDGTKIAYQGPGGIFLVDLANGTKPQQIASGGPPSYETGNNLVWLTQDELLFAANQEGNAEIYSVKTDGSQLTNLTQNPGDDQWIVLTH